VDFAAIEVVDVFEGTGAGISTGAVAGAGADASAVEQKENFGGSEVAFSDDEVEERKALL